MGDLPAVRLPNADGETLFSWSRGGDRVEAVVHAKDQRIFWVGKFAGVYEHGGDEPFPPGLTTMLLRLGIEMPTPDEPPTHPTPPLASQQIGEATGTMNTEETRDGE